MSSPRNRFGGLFLAGLLVAALPGMGATASVAEAPLPSSASSTAAAPADTSPRSSLIESFALGAESLRTELERTLGELTAVTPTATTIRTGTDRRLTILLLGSDYRPGYRYLEHTDVIMVVSLDMATKRLAMASIPRDVAYFPIHPDNRTGAKNSGTMRVNLLYDEYKTQAAGVIERGALEKFKKDVAYALDMEIDYYSYIRFSGFDALMDNVDGVKVDITAKIVDPTYQDVASPPFGIKFPVKYGWRLGGAEAKRCSGTVKNCKRGIVYVRSRKGTVGSIGNSDANRVRRQQGLVLAAIRKVSTGGADLSSLRSASFSHITTSLPTSWDDATWLRNKLKKSISYASDRIVFIPPTYAKEMANPKYSSKLKNKAVRGWIAQHMH